MARVHSGKAHAISSEGMATWAYAGVDIRTCSRDLRSFCPVRVTLDWFHLRRRCCELPGMGAGTCHLECAPACARRSERDVHEKRLPWARTTGARCAIDLECIWTIPVEPPGDALCLWLRRQGGQTKKGVRTILGRSERRGGAAI